MQSDYCAAAQGVKRHWSFYPAYALVFLSGFAGVVAFGAQLKSGIHRIHHRTHIREPQGCVSVKCAKIGDHVEYTVKGVVTQVSSPQPGVICVQVSARTSAGDRCELVR